MTPEASLPLWPLIAKALREAPLRTRRALGLQLLALVVITVVTLLLSTSGDDRFDVASAVTVLLTNGGLALWLVAVALHRLGQGQVGVACRAAGKQLEPRVLHRLLEVAPLLTIVSALLLAVAIGTTVLRLGEAPVLLVTLAVLVFFEGLLLRTVAATIRSVRHDILAFARML